MNVRTSIFSLTLVLSGCAVKDATRSVQQYEQGKLDEGKSALIQLANEGYHDAKLSLARIYANEMDKKNATHWYSESIKIYPLAELEYFKWRINNADIEQADALYSSLWLRQNAQGDAFPLLVSLYRKFYEQYDSHELVPLVNNLLQHNEIDAIRYAIDLSDVTPLYPDLINACPINSNDNLTRSRCLKLELIHALKSNDLDLMKDVRNKLLTDYDTNKLSAESISNIANIAKNKRYGAPNIPLYVSLAEIIGTDLPDIWYGVAKRKIQMQGTEESDLVIITKQANTLSNSGYTKAHLILGQMYLKGLATSQNYEKAIGQWKEAIEFPEAQRLLGETYLSGAVGEEHLEEGIKWLLNAARSGDNKAYLTLAQIFKNGNGIMPEPTTAFIFASVHFELSNSLKSKQILDELLPKIPSDLSNRIESEKTVRHLNTQDFRLGAKP
nr:tetratricopeptide repeat protein [Vibrio marinisediminis]